jgi:prepilin-type N-terminal cleavage/methylation domain-containing protein
MNLINPAHRADRGFTLPELLISVVIIATIATVMVGVTSVVLRNTPSTQARAEDARSMMGLVTWLPQDVDSTPPTGFDVGKTTDSGCGTDPAGSTNLLRLQWRERASSATYTTYIANYRSVSTANGLARIERVTCSGLGDPPFTSRTSLNMTSDLPPLPIGWVPGAAPAAVAIDAPAGSVPLVTFAVTTLDGDVVYTDSAPKNPAMTLPSTTSPSWKPPAPEPETEANVPPEALDLLLTVHRQVTANATLTVTDGNGDPLIVELNPATVPLGWTVTLASVALSITAPADAALNVPYVVSYIVDDDRGGVITGNVTVTAVDPSAPTTTATSSTSSTLPTSSTTTTTVAPSCVVTAQSISPASVKNVQPDSNNQGGGKVQVGVLLNQVVVTATTNTHCQGLLIKYNSGGANSPPSRTMTATSATSWTVTLEGRDQGSSETWADGSHEIAFFSANGGPWGSVTLEVT